jgi:hypothetical protein
MHARGRNKEAWWVKQEYMREWHRAEEREGRRKAKIKAKIQEDQKQAIQEGEKTQDRDDINEDGNNISPMNVFHPSDYEMYFSEAESNMNDLLCEYFKTFNIINKLRTLK